MLKIFQKEIKPIKVNAYKCPIPGCNYVSFDRERAEEHVSEPVSPLLPKELYDSFFPIFLFKKTIYYAERENQKMEEIEKEIAKILCIFEGSSEYKKFCGEHSRQIAYKEMSFLRFNKYIKLEEKPIEVGTGRFLRNFTERKGRRDEYGTEIEIMPEKLSLFSEEEFDRACRTLHRKFGCQGGTLIRTTPELEALIAQYSQK